MHIEPIVINGTIQYWYLLRRLGGLFSRFGDSLGGPLSSSKLKVYHAEGLQAAHDLQFAGLASNEVCSPLTAVILVHKPLP